MGFLKFFQPEYMSYTAEEFAKDNGILYVPAKAEDLKIPGKEANRENALLLAQERFAMLIPPNDGLPTCPFVFYRIDKKGRYVEVLNNQKAFREITNLSQVLLQMTQIYNRHLESQIFLDPMSFAIRLTDNINRDYHGRAELALTANTLCNNNVPPKKQDDARRSFYNEFLDHFIGWNFGRAVDESEGLRRALEQLAMRLTEKGLREKAKPGFDVWGSTSVWHVDYIDGVSPEIVRF